MNQLQNCKIWYWIGRDGKTKEKVMLSFRDGKKREEIIAYHFRCFYKGAYGFDLPSKLIERDSPHDFTFSSNSGEKLFLEIVAVSDADSGFKKQSNQIKLDKILDSVGFSTIAILPHNTNNKELKEAVQKLNSTPIIQNINDELSKLYEELFISKKPVIRRINDKARQRLTLTDGENPPLEKIIHNAIKYKENKKYPKAQGMVLIVDEQLIQYSVKDFEKACVNLLTKFGKYTFKEIFVYSGRYSNNDGNEASFSFYPIKALRDKRVGRILFIKKITSKLKKYLPFKVA